MRQEPHRLVFLDETFVNTTMTRLRGRVRKGQRLRASAPFGPWKTHHFLAGLRCHELSAPWVIDGPITRSTFEVYIETQLTLGLVNALATRVIELPRATELEAGQALVAIARVKRRRGHRDLWGSKGKHS
jgi:hypothetical protein